VVSAATCFTPRAPIWSDDSAPMKSLDRADRTLAVIAATSSVLKVATSSEVMVDRASPLIAAICVADRACA